MTTSEFLAELRRLGVRLRLADGELKVSAPKGALSAEVRAELARRKTELHAFLAGGDEEEPAPERLPRADRSRPLPLSFTQQRLWFLDQLHPGLLTYNMWVALHLIGPLDEGALEAALEEIVRRHDVLRTCYPETDGVPRQEVDPDLKVPLERVLPPTGIEEGAWREEAHARMQAMLAEPYDLARGPMSRARLVRLARQEHVLLFLVHHIAFDGLSKGVFARELTQLYEAFIAGEASPLTPLPIQYADYAAWQRGFLDGPAFDRQMAYWRDVLSGELPILALPTDRPHPKVETHQGGSAWRLYPKKSIDALARLAGREGTTLYVALLALYKALLLRWCGQEDLIVGTAVGNRTRAETEGLLGYFVNTIALRSDLSGDPTFVELLHRERDVVLGAMEHQDTPFERLVDELVPERNMAYSPIFQTLFVLDEDTGESRAMGPFELKQYDLELPVTRTDLVFVGFRDRKYFQLIFEYNTALFDATTIQRLQDYFGRMLEGVLERPEARLSEVDVLGGEERALVLEEWNATATDAAPRAVHAWFEEQVDARPGELAVAMAALAGDGTVHLSGELTYAELDRRANRLAHHLLAAGVEVGELVGLALPRSVDMVVSQLAIQKAGAAYVPLDPEFPRDRLRYMVDDAGVRRVVTIAAEADAWREAEVSSICLDAEEDAIERRSDARPDVPADPDRCMYVIYTSGSTGRPKGVEIVHSAVANFLGSMAHTPGLAAGERLLALTTLSFDISVLETMLPLVTGAAVIVAPKAAVTDGERLRAIVEGLSPDVLQATPATWRMLRMAGWEGTAGLRLFCGGEALPRELADELLGCGDELWNLYGPTETTIWSAVHRVEPGEGPVSIGRPIDNTRVYVLDPHLRPTPLGVPGELWIAGEGLARGYLGRPDLTAERFVPDPFAQRAGARMYRTGDLARWLASGRLECLGRVDDQVKLRGFRIELGEIEAVLKEGPGVQEAVCVVSGAGGDERLVAYLVAAPGAEPAPDVLRDHASARLPAYMVPAVYERIETLPLTPNKKVDRRALAARELGPIARPAFVAPRDELERVVAAVFAEVLKVDAVGIDDDFFALGGNSLLTTQVLSRLRRDLEAELTLLAMFETPTVRGIAERVRAAEPGAPPLPPLERAPRDRPLPLSFTQQRLWFLDRLEPGLSAYNIQWAWRMLGPLDVARLERVLALLVARHEVLRTSFPEVDGEPYQAIAAPGPVSLEVVEVEAGELDELLLARMEAPFDLARGPLFAPFLVRLGAEEHVFCVRAHHTVWDGWSGGVFRRELAALYEADPPAGEVDALLGALPLQYADYAAWQRRVASDEAYAAQLEYWREALGGELPTLALPLDHPRPQVVTYRGKNAERRVPAALLARLDALAAGVGATRFMALLTVFELLLARWTHGTDVIVGTPVAGRSRTELEPLIGFFANTLALRTDLSGDPGFREACRRVRRTSLGAMEHQDVPFEELVDELGVERDLATTPVFQALFVLEAGGDAAGDAGDGMGDVRFGSVELETRVARTELTLWGQDLGDEFLFWAEYNADLFEQATADRFLQGLAALLEDVVERPDAPLSQLRVLTAADEETLATWNDTRTAWPRDSSIVREFEARVRERPEAVAAVIVPATPGDAAHELTYAELNARANRLAHHLVARGVEEGELVGLCAERTLEMLVGVLAILKAGGAYLPLDPGYPAERLAFMLADGAVRVLLAQERVRAALPGFDGALVLLEDEAAWAAEPATDPPPRCGPDSLAYTMFTSGSTGRPKGVCVEHRSVLRLVTHPNFAHLGPDETLLHFAPISFDASTLEVWGALLRGGRMVVYPPTQPSLEDLGRVLREYGVTTAWLTAGLFSLMVDERLEDLGGLRQLLTGGDVLPVPQVNRVLERYPELHLINGYGPTENTTFTACHAIHEEGRVEGAVPIGRPVSDTQVHVVDEHLARVPIGVAGELLAGGDGVARGYLNRPELTAERFVTCEWAPGERLYRTGDLVRWRHDGVLEFLGRTDDQVKVRGFRIELGEVEACLAGDPGVRDGVSIVREDQPGDKRIVAYVVPEAGAALDPAALRARAEAELPGYMVPAHVVVLDELPLSPNGKVDRRALPAPDLSAAARGEDFVAPRTETERRLAAIWADVLGIERVGVTDNFFDLGGNSLLSTKAISRTSQAFGREVALRELFLEPTVAGLAARLGDDAALEEVGYEAVFDRSLLPLQPRGARPPLFLVSGAHAHEDDFLRFVGEMLPYLGSDQPIYGFKARGLDGVQEPHGSAEEMAAAYVRELRAFRPEGPYLLAGNCVGGIVAYEMARQLEEAGQEVALVALLDTTCPREEYRAFVAEHYRFWKLERFVGHWNKLRELPLRERLSYFTSRLSKKVKRRLPLSEEDRRRAHVERVERNYSQVLAAYRPAPYHGRVTLIINEEFQREVPNGGWDEVASDLDVRVVAGDHVTRLSMNGRENAELLLACIRAALAERAPARAEAVTPAG